MSSQIRSRYDIIINGGGIVGFTLLNLLLKSPHLNRPKVLLIEQATKPKSLKQPHRLVQKLSDSSASSQDGSIDANTPDEKIFSNRVSSITQASRVTLRRIGVWDRVRDFSKDAKRIKVWNYDYSHHMVFMQDQSPGYLDSEDRETVFTVVENNRLSLALLDSIYRDCKASEKIAWNHSLENLTSNNGLIDITATDKHTGETLNASAPLVLGCDGFKSKVRELTSMNYREFDLKKTAVVGTVKMDSLFDSLRENDIAYQRFSADKDTVAALLPLDSEYCSFVISAPDAYAKYLMDCDDDTFTIEFNQLLSNTEQPGNSLLRGFHDVANLASDSMRAYLRTLSPTGGKASGYDDDLIFGAFHEPPRLESVVKNSRACFPLVFGTTTPKMISPIPSVALLGDSSHRVHPLAGQGLNLGIQDAAELVDQLESIARYGERLFNEKDPTLLQKALARYERNRQLYAVPIMGGILSMQSLFKLMPSSVVSSANKLNAMKNSFVRVANGC